MLPETARHRPLRSTGHRFTYIPALGRRRKASVGLATEGKVPKVAAVGFSRLARNTVWEAKVPKFRVFGDATSIFAGSKIGSNTLGR